MPLVPKAWMPACSMKRVVLHWTAGGYNPTDHDKASYHVLIDGSGELVRGTHSIADNVSTADGVYAAHTKGANTGSIGVACCSMAGAVEKPFQPGPNPMKEEQWVRMAEVTADLCKFYQIAVSSKTVLGHGEVTTNLGIKQDRWDPMVLPWNPGLSWTQVGSFFRTIVENLIEGDPLFEETPADIRVLIQDQEFEAGFLSNGDSYVMLAPAAQHFGWTIEGVAGGIAQVRIGAQTHALPCEILGERGYVTCGALATALGLGISWNGTSRTVMIA